MSEVDCPFCKPEGRVVLKNELARVVLSNPRKVPGHCLVVPKRHVEQPWDVTSKELAAIFELIFEIEQKMIGKLGDGANIRQNYLPFVDQNNLKVDHVHFHVIPRSQGDYIYKVADRHEDGLYAALDDFEREEVTKLLYTNNDE